MTQSLPLADVVDELDFAQPCSAKECTRPAAWVLVSHCPVSCTDRVGVFLGCDEHARQLRDRLPMMRVYCSRCGVVRPYVDCILRFERLDKRGEPR